MRRFWPLENPWNNGILEKWNIGDQKRMMVYFYFLPYFYPCKIFFSHFTGANTALLQHSNTPSLHPAETGFAAKPIFSGLA
jgi:hypothetical protein